MEERDRDSEAAGSAEETRFLPPEPAGPEPELTDRPPQPPPPPQQQTYGYPPPASGGPPQQTYGYPPPAPGAPPAGPGQPPGGGRPAGGGQPPGGAQPPPGYGHPPPGYPPPPGYAPPPGYPPPGYGAPPAWGYPPQPRVPDNGQAVAGFVFSLVGVGLLVISFGLSSIVSLGCSITGVICSRNGKRKVESGETPKHRGLAQAGFIIGWVGVVLAILATAGWILAIALGAIDESSGSDPQGYELSIALLVGS